MRDRAEPKGEEVLKQLFIDPDVYKYINEYQKKKTINSFTTTVKVILAEHKELSSAPTMADRIAAEIEKMETE